MGSGFGIRKQAAFSSCAFVAVALGAQSAFGHDAAGIVNQEVNSASRSIQAALAATPVSEAETSSLGRRVPIALALGPRLAQAELMVSATVCANAVLRLRSQIDKRRGTATNLKLLSTSEFLPR